MALALCVDPRGARNAGLVLGMLGVIVYAVAVGAAALPESLAPIVLILLAGALLVAHVSLHRLGRSAVRAGHSWRASEIGAPRRPKLLQ